MMRRLRAGLALVGVAFVGLIRVGALPESAKSAIDDLLLADLSASCDRFMMACGLEALLARNLVRFAHPKYGQLVGI